MYLTILLLFYRLQDFMFQEYFQLCKFYPAMDETVLFIYNPTILSKYALNPT